MRKTTCFLLISLVLAGLVLAACGNDRESTPTQLDAPFQGPSHTPRPSNTPWPSPWPTDTRVPITPRPSITAYPTPVDDGTDEPLDDYVVPGNWLRETFLDEANEPRTLADFSGHMILVHILSASCEGCIEQQEFLLDAIQDRYEIGALSNTVFLGLGMVPTESAALLRTTYERESPERWAAVNELLAESDAEFLFGSATQNLLDALVRDFGPDSIVPEAGIILVIEQDGLAHPMPEGIAILSDLIDAITYYGNQ